MVSCISHTRFAYRGACALTSFWKRVLSSTNAPETQRPNNRIHLDLATSDAVRDHEIERVLALGIEKHPPSVHSTSICVLRVCTRRGRRLPDTVSRLGSRRSAGVR